MPRPTKSRTCGEPKTRAEWQEAADLAHVYLLIDSARKYGLLTGGPESIDLDRCEHLLKQAKERGIVPRPDAVDRFIAMQCRHEIEELENQTENEGPSDEQDPNDV